MAARRAAALWLATTGLTAAAAAWQLPRGALAPAAAAAAAAGDDDACPVDAFTCHPVANATVLSPSWCDARNPFIVAQPPSRLANASTDVAAYQQWYRCDSHDPFAQCDQIDNFMAYEFPAYSPVANTTGSLKLIVIAQRTSNVSYANSSLGIYDSHFNLLRAPLTAFPGRLVLLDLLANPDTNGTTTFVTYGGPVRGGWGVPTDGCGFGCLNLEFIEMNLMAPDALANTSQAGSNAVFLSSGWYTAMATRAVDVWMFTSRLDAASLARLAAWRASAAASLPPHLAARVADAADADAPSPATVFSFAALLQYANVSTTVAPAGWSVVYFMHFPADSPYCLAYSVPGYPCFLPAASWALVANGTALPWEAGLKLRTTPYYHDCATPANVDPLAWAYDTFYNTDHCAKTQLLAVMRRTSVAVFAFALENRTVDLDATPLTAVVDTLPLAPRGAADVTDVTLWTEVTLRAPAATAAPVDTPAPPSAVWLAVATARPLAETGAGNDASPQGSLFVFQLAQFAAPVDGAYPPFVPPTVDNPAGALPAAAACRAAQRWNGTACVPLPHRNVTTGADIRVLALRAAWRSLPQSTIIALEGAGCLPWNVTCIAALVNATASSPLPTLALERGVARRRAAAASPATRADLCRWLGAAAAAVEGGASAAAAARDAMAANYGNRFVLFASLSNARVGILDAVPLGCDTTNAVGLVLSVANVLSMMGNLRTLQVTPNGQFMFGAVSRPRFFLSSMERAVEVCNELRRDPTNAFLAPLASSCSNNPRLPTTADFLQVATACLPGMYCPSFAAEEVAMLPGGEYTTFSFDRTTCEPGAFCSDGRRTACPTGFMCPAPGMALPIECDPDPALSHTCFTAGTVAPALCPNGTLCVTPYLPPMPAPPGYAQNGTDARRSLMACTPGMYCNLGRTAADGADALLCPAGTYCDAPTVMQPTVCNLGGACNASSCPLIPLCEAGATAEALCPAGAYCPTTMEAVPCSAGTYCPAGSPLWQLCPAASYCPNSSLQVECPGGSYCPQGSFVPIECVHVAHCYCDGGCAEPPVSIVLPVAGGVIAGAAALYLVWRLWLRQWCAERRRRARDARRKRKPAPGRAPPSMGVPLLASGASSLELVAGAPPALHASLNAAASVASLAASESDSDAGDAPRAAPPRASVRRAASVRLTRKTFTVDIAFADLGLRLKAGGRSVLDGVTGQLRHGRVCAVMGPSGAGKTTFLTALCGKATYGTLVGDVALNGRPALLTDAAYKHLVGFVPQEDIMMRDLTVEENIAYAALTRLPAAWPTEDKLAFADGVVDLLGLTDIRDSAIGDESVRGISGGQRKRVNIGIELAADPTVLFLDEPTSGLDAASSMEVCSALRRIADMGLTIALVLHQPRFEIFQSFDDLLLLGKGGKTVYIGPVADALPYFETSLAVTCPPRINPADFLLDVVGGDMPREWRAAHPEWRPTALFTMWEHHAAAAAAAADAAAAALSPEAAEAAAYLASVARTPRAPPAHDPVNFFVLVARVLRRSLTQQLRHPGILALDNLLAMVSALFLAVVYFGTPSYAAPEPIEVFAGCADAVAGACQVCLAEAGDSLINRGVMTIISISLTGVATFLRVFGGERVVYWREASALPQPVHTVAYFLGKDLSMVPQLLAGPLVFTMAYEALTTPRAPFSQYYAVFFSVYWCASAFGYLTSVLAPPSLAQLLGVTTIFANAMFAGGQPTLPAMAKKFIPLCYLPYASYMRWALEASYVAEVRNYEEVVALQGVDLATLVSNNFGFQLDSFARNTAIVFAIGCGLRLVALVAMMLKDAEKKK